MNKRRPHVYILPEDRRDEQIANGFVGHHQVNEVRVRVMPPAGGWPAVLEKFCTEYVPELRRFGDAHVILLIDFDDQVEDRRTHFERQIPVDLKDRVFVIGPRHNPELLKKESKKNWETIGECLADDCDAGTTAHWDHEQLSHNDRERQRLYQTVRPILF